ncbi:MAG: hypothetical protein IJ458_02210 [Clostridia bacterium]|nr:hypothetical protein [Clostridia bacterium]
MEKIGLEVNELEQLFAKVKQGYRDVDAKIYNAYLPLIEMYSTKFNLKQEQVQDLYNDIFSYVYNNVLQGSVSPSEFTICFENILAKQCMKAQSMGSGFRSELLSTANARRRASRKNEEQLRAKESATQSLLFIIQVLDEIASEPDLMEEYGLNAQKIAIIKDYYGLNKEHARYNVNQIVGKYNISETRARAVLVSGMKKLRDMQDFDQIKAELR